MNKGRLSLTHLIREPTGTDSPPPLLLLLHGVGSNERDLMGLASWLDGRLFVVSARAPIALGYEAYGWFRFYLTPDQPDGPVVLDPREAENSYRLILHFIDELVEVYGVDPDRAYLMGFSQGTIMALSVALTRPDKVAGVVAMSGRFPDAIRPQIAPPKQLRGLPILLQHGTEDPVLPVQYGRAARETLNDLPVRLDYHEYRMGHHVTQESLADASAWLTARLDG